MSIKGHFSYCSFLGWPNLRAEAGETRGKFGLLNPKSRGPRLPWCLTTPAQPGDGVTGFSLRTALGSFPLRAVISDHVLERIFCLVFSASFGWPLPPPSARASVDLWLALLTAVIGELLLIAENLPELTSLLKSVCLTGSCDSNGTHSGLWVDNEQLSQWSMRTNKSIGFISLDSCQSLGQTLLGFIFQIAEWWTLSYYFTV